MFQWLGRILDRLFVVFGALLFLQAPIYMQQYQHQLIGRVAELQLQVQAMRRVALASNKTLEQYIQKFLTYPDNDFSQQGSIMSETVARSQKLSEGLLALDRATLLTRPWTFLKYFNYEIGRSTLHNFQLGMPFTEEGLIYALAGMSIGYFLYLALRRLFSYIARSFRGSPLKKEVQ